jgi:hypothetical protein
MSLPFLSGSSVDLTSRLRLIAARFCAASRAAAAVEFALCSGALFFFLLAIVNIGDAGLVLGNMERSAEATARAAAVKAAVNYSTSASTPAVLTCPNTGAIRTIFNGFAVPGLKPSSGSSTDGTPVITVTWGNGNINAGTYPPGVSLNLTVTYKWKPIGLGLTGAGMNFGISTVASVLGTAGVTSMASCTS